MENNKNKLVRSENHVKLYNVVSDESRHIVDHDKAKERLKTNSIKLSDSLERLQSDLGVKPEIAAEQKSDNEENKTPLIDVKRSKGAYKKQSGVLKDVNRRSAEQFKKAQDVRNATRRERGTDVFKRAVFYDAEKTKLLDTQTHERKYTMINGEKRYDDKSYVHFPEIKMREFGYDNVDMAVYDTPNEVPDDDTLTHVLSKVDFTSRLTEDNEKNIGSFVYHRIPNMYYKHNYFKVGEDSVHQKLEHLDGDTSRLSVDMSGDVSLKINDLLHQVRSRISPLLSSENGDRVLEYMDDLTKENEATGNENNGLLDVDTVHTYTDGFSMSKDALTHWIFINYLEQFDTNDVLPFLEYDRMSFIWRIESLEKEKTTGLTRYHYKIKYNIHFT